MFQSAHLRRRPHGCAPPYAAPMSPLRLLVAVLVLLLLARAGRVAWTRRELARDVWRSVGRRHVLGAFALLVLVIGTSLALISAAPVLGRGLGDLLGTTGNVVFAPVDAAADATSVGTTDASPFGTVAYLVAITLFLGTLLALLPWFAFVEEEVFRAGAESWTLPQRVVAALRFGAAHLVMLVPFAAAIAIGVAGFVYGEIYRRGVEAGPSAPASVRSAFRPTKRSTAAAHLEARSEMPAGVGHDSESGSVAALQELALHDALERQVRGLHASTVWHTSFNSLVVVLVWLTLVLDALR